MDSYTVFEDPLPRTSLYCNNKNTLKPLNKRKQKIKFILRDQRERNILFHIFQKDQLQQTQSHLVQDGWCCSSFPKQRIKKSNTQIENIKKILEKRKRNTYSNVFYLVGFVFFFRVAFLLVSSLYLYHNKLIK